MTAPSPAIKTFTCDLERIGLSPYTWKLTGTSKEARAEAGMPGAYLKAVVSNTTTIGLVIDGTANMGCTADGMPVIEYSVDDGPFRHQQLSQTSALYTDAGLELLACRDATTFGDIAELSVILVSVSRKSA